MTRGNRRAIIFEEDEDRRCFLSILAGVAERYEVLCLAYCLMGTHYHLVIQTPRGNLSDVMRQLNGVFAQTSNRRHCRCGHVFDGRFRAFVIQRESYLRRAIRYVVLNPVRAHLASKAADWPWSSYEATVGASSGPAFLSLGWLDDAFGGSSRSDAQLQFAHYVNNPVRRSESIDVNAPVFGGKTFQAKVMSRAAAAAEKRVPWHWTVVARPSLAGLLRDCEASRSGRDEAIWRAHAAHGYRLAEIARALNLHPSTASQIVRRRQRSGRVSDQARQVSESGDGPRTA